MMIRKIVPALMIFGLFVWLTPLASATCNAVWPPYNLPHNCELHVGQSLCLKVCPGDTFGYDPLMLVGPHFGDLAIPQLIFERGCGQNTRCNSDPCTPVTCVPTWPFVLGGDPWGFYPDCYYGSCSCMDFILCHDHDNFWSLTPLTVTCEGCFCLTYDHQLAVNLRAGLAAVGGNDEVTLTWATASEADNARFDIYRGETVVGNVPGLINSSVGRNYSWTDDNVQNGRAYTYTLKGVDVNGGVTTLGTASATPRTAGAGTVTEYALYQNYPNPFNPTTSIAFDVVEPSNVTLKVYNPMGMEVATLVNGPVSSGNHSVMFNAADVTSGLYFYKIQIGDRFTATRKMLLVK